MGDESIRPGRLADFIGQRLVGWRRRVLKVDQMCQALERLGPADKEALDLIAAMRPQEFRL